MRCGCFFFLLAIALIGFGIDGIHKASSYHAPVTMTYDAFARSNPKEGWYRITGCRLELPDAVYSVTTLKGGSVLKDEKDNPLIDKVYLPVHNGLGPDPAQVHLVIETEDKQIIETIKEIKRIDKASDAEAKKWIHENMARLVLQRDLQGMVSESSSQDSDVRDKMRTIPGLSPNYSVLTDGDKPPTMLMAMVSLVGGGVLFVVMCLVFVSNFIKPGENKA